MRILRLSKKYNIRPSKVIEIDDSYVAFCFDEACEYILSMRGIRNKKKEGKTYQEEYWTKLPLWIDEDRETTNSTVINIMLENLKQYQ